MGCQAPKMTATKAMKPRPLVMFSVKLRSAPTESSAPPRAQRAPAMSSACSRTIDGFTPAERAANGYSPTAASRSPKRLRRSTNQAASTITGVIHTNIECSAMMTPAPSVMPRTGRGRTTSVNSEPRTSNMAPRA